MIYLTLYNNLWIKIDTEDITSLNLIKEHFSYRPEGYQFSKLYKSGAWNGYIQLFDYRNRMLPYGLLFDLIKLLKNNNYDIQASDEVKNIYKNYSYDSISFNYDLKYYPRYYQDEIIKSCIKHKCGVFSSATASGKSLSLAYIVKILKENNSRSIMVYSTHGVFSNDAITKLTNSPIKTVNITNTIPLPEKVLINNKFNVISVDSLLAKAINSIHENNSVSELFI